MRFMPGETNKTAIFQLESEILRSTKHTNLGEMVNDFFHNVNKDTTVQTVIDNTGQVTASVVKGGLKMGKKASKYLSGWW